MSTNIIDIPVNYFESNGKKWILAQSSYSLQCAYCIYIQPLIIIRDDTGLVISLKFDFDNQTHKEDCPQHG